MESLKKFLSMNKNAEGYSFIGKVSDKSIAESESKLGVNFSVELKDYLALYGSLSYRSVEFFGIGKGTGSFFNIVSRSLILKKESTFPENHVPIAYIDDGYYAIYNCNNKKVYEWHLESNSKKMIVLGSSLEKYMISRLIEANEIDGIDPISGHNM